RWQAPPAASTSAGRERRARAAAVSAERDANPGARRSSAATPSRRFPLAVFALAAAILIWVWLLSNEIRQMQMIYTYAVVLFGTIALASWWGRARAARGAAGRRARWAPLLVLAGAASLFLLAFRVKGITGDWIPVVEPRWAHPASTAGTAAETSATPARVTDSFPRFLGPRGDSVLPGVHLARDWSARPPRLLWQRPVGAGWSGFAIAAGRAFTLEQRGELETVAAYDLATGDELWSHGDRAFFTNPMAGPGPRA